MLSRIRKQITLTNMLLTVALVFAMSGGAYAASKYLITSTKQISPKVLKALAGKPGAKGATGSTGPAGKQGPTGAKGETGPIGKEGPAGKEGINGGSVSVKEVKTTETACAKQGGSSFTGGSTTTLACNGKEGSPWTDKGTLPKGSSERGQWSIGGYYKKFHIEIGNLSFPIPLAAPLTEEKVHFIGYKEGAGENLEAVAIKNGECTGTWREPGARSGNLCVFISTFESGIKYPSYSIGNAESGETGAGISGATLAGFSDEEEELNEGVDWNGSWVVTG